MFLTRVITLRIPRSKNTPPDYFWISKNFWSRAMIIARAQDDLLQDARPNRARGAAFVGGLPDPCNPATRLPSNPAVLNQCTWMQGDDAA